MLTLLFWAEEEDSSRTSVIRMIRSGGDGMMDGSPIHTTERLEIRAVVSK